MKAVIFDMDGLMFDTSKVFEEVWDNIGEKMGMGKAGYMIYKTHGMSISLSKDIWTSEFGDLYDVSELKKLTKEHLTEYYTKNKGPAKQGLFDLLKYLRDKKVKLAVASSAPKWEVYNHLEKAEIIECFTVIVDGSMVSSSKPAPEIYLKACDLLGENPADCIALEDSKNGILSAHSAGCQTIMIPDVWQPDSEIKSKVHKIFNNLHEFELYLYNFSN